jgi:DNA-binding transcriptional MerR regulator
VAQPDAIGIKIGHLIKATGVTRATIHHYVKEGLLPEPTKTSRNMALYGRDCVDRILLIKGLQKHSRRSLAEVKALLEDAGEDEGLRRLRGLLEVEAMRVQTSALNPERPREPVVIGELAKISGFSVAEIREFEELGLVTGRGSGDARVYGLPSVDVVNSLAGLRDVGFTGDRGFAAQDALIYLEALQGLLHKEVAKFLERAPQGAAPEEIVALAQQGVERVTPLLLALRRKLIDDFLQATPLPAKSAKA